MTETTSQNYGCGLIGHFYSFRTFFFLLLFIFLAAQPLFCDESITDWNGFEKSGLNTVVEYSRWKNTIDVAPEGTIFSPETTSVTWWAKPALKVYKMGFSKPKFDVQWYAPDGTLYSQETIKKGAEQGYFIKSELKIYGSHAAKLPGEWRVEVHYKDKIVEKRPFKITSGQETAPEQNAQPVQQAPLVQDEAYKRAKELFAAGNYNEAAPILQTILKEQPSRTDAHFALASVYFRQQKFEESIKELDYVLQNPQYRQDATNLREQILKIQAEKKAHA